MANTRSQSSRMGGRRQRSSIASAAAMVAVSCMSAEAFVVPSASRLQSPGSAAGFPSDAVSGAFMPTVNARTPMWATGAAERR